MMEVNSINTLPAVTSSLLAETCQQSKQSCLNNILCYCLKVVVRGIYQPKVSFRIKAVQQECLLMILFIWMYTSLATAQWAHINSKAYLYAMNTKSQNKSYIFILNVHHSSNCLLLALYFYNNKNKVHLYIKDAFKAIE